MAGCFPGRYTGPTREGVTVRRWLGVYVVLSIGDVVATSYALAHSAHEANSIVARIYSLFGVAGLWLDKLAVVLIVVAGIWWLRRWWPRLPWMRPVTWAAVAVIILLQLAATGTSVLACFP